MCSANVDEVRSWLPNTRDAYSLRQVLALACPMRHIYAVTTLRTAVKRVVQETDHRAGVGSPISNRPTMNVKRQLITVEMSSPASDIDLKLAHCELSIGH